MARLSLLLWVPLGPLRARLGGSGVDAMVGPREAVSSPGWFPYLLSASGASRLQELALRERILLSSGICAVTGFDPWD